MRLITIGQVFFYYFCFSNTLILFIWAHWIGGHFGQLDNINSSALFNYNNYFFEEKFRLNCTVPICDGELSEIYCTGTIVFASWYFGLHTSCPGPRLKFDSHIVLDNFKKLSRPLNRVDFEMFCTSNFDAVPYLQPAKLNDWKENPKPFERIFSPKMRKFVVRLHHIWKDLSREFMPDVFLNKNRYPVLPVPNRFVVPGGFFQVYFYWDSYWILKGLLFSELYETALGILRNFGEIIKIRGFLPNSGNIELSRRSQPPFFVQMIFDYLNKFNGSEIEQKAFLNEFLPYAEKEINWWQKNRLVTVTQNVKTFNLYQYRAETNCPRPENFLQDYELGLRTGAATAETYWSSTASACESGIDFSSRWFKQNVVNLTGLQTNKIVPVDLNVFLAQNFQILSTIYTEIIQDETKAKKYGKMALDLSRSIDQVFLDKKLGVWFDYDLITKDLRRNFFPSNIYPLLLNRTSKAQCSQIMRYLNVEKALTFKGGVPSSMEMRSKEQWDFPNTWAPSNHLFVLSLLNCDSKAAKNAAKSVANAFLTTVYNGLFNSLPGIPAQVWEKYDARYDTGISGFGGEYPAQAGFGWTNGVVMEFIRLFYTDKEHPSFLRDNNLGNENFFFGAETQNFYELVDVSFKRQTSKTKLTKEINFFNWQTVMIIFLVSLCILLAILYVFLIYKHEHK